MLGIDPLNLDVTISNMRAKMMMFRSDMLGTRMHFGSIGQFHTTLIILKDGKVSSSCVEGKTSQGSEFS
jgi:hypothetical protein